MSKIISGRFDWHELWTLDAAASTRFYSHVFPWTSELWDKETGYALFMGKNGPDAGCYPLGADSTGHGAKAGWNTYISAADVDATAQLALQHGATLIVPAMEIPRVGRFAMLADPQGAVFGLLCRKEPRAARPLPPPAGATVWNELLTSDAEAALKFYSRVFGWQLITAIDMGPSGKYWVFGADGEQLGGMMTAPVPGGPLWLPYTQVDDADAVVAVAVKAGATLCLGPRTVPGGGRIANFLDPQGVMFAVHSMPATMPAPAAAKTAKKSSGAAKKPAALAPKAKPKTKAKKKSKSLKRAAFTRTAKKKRLKVAARKSAGRASKRKRAPTRRNKTAKRAAVKKSAKRAAKKSGRGKSKRTARRPTRR